ncbi:MAG: DNA-directed RNA polymerase subunit P [Thermoplasmata archaeon]
MMEKMKVACPTCGTEIELDDPTLDEMNCPHCGRKIVFGKKSDLDV